MNFRPAARRFPKLSRNQFLIAFCLLLPLLRGQVSSGPKYENAVGVSFPGHSYGPTYPSIKAVDFRNFSHRLYGDAVRLRKGKFSKNYRPEPGITEVTLDKIVYFGASVEKDHVLLVFDYFSAVGSSSDRGIVQVLTLRDGHPIVTQELDYDRQAPGTGESFDPKKLVLTITARASDQSAHCCPENIEKEIFEWDGSRFTLRRSIVSKLPASVGR